MALPLSVFPPVTGVAQNDTLIPVGTGNDAGLYLRSTSLTANTAVSGIIVGTPITPALAADTLIIGNVTADGDILICGQTGGNTHAVFFADLSAGTTSIMVAGVAVARFDSTDVLLPDDYILTMGTGCSVAYKSSSTNANTAVTNVILGTPVVPALAADTLIISNQIADGDLLLATQTGGNTQAAIFVDGSAGTVGLYAAGVAKAIVSSSGLTVGVAGTSLGVMRFAGNTAGHVTVNSAATAGDWTLTLPPDDGDAGEQLQTNGSGVCTWEGAGSLAEFKELLGSLNDRADEALSRVLKADVQAFRYRRQQPGQPRPTTTGDFKTVYRGVIGNNYPEVMHHNGRIFSPVNAFGELVLAVQALNRRLDELAK